CATSGPCGSSSSTPDGRRRDSLAPVALRAARGRRSARGPLGSRRPRASGEGIAVVRAEARPRRREPLLAAAGRRVSAGVGGRRPTREHGEMPRMLRLLFAVLLAGPGVAAQKALHVERFHADVTVREDSVLEVQETLRVRFDGAWNGLLRWFRT